MRARFLALLLGAVLLVVSGCEQPPGPAVDAVRAYVRALPSALHADTLDEVAPVATPEQLDRIRRYVAKVLNDGYRMEATLEELTVTEAAEDGGQATVETRERWTIVYRDANSGAFSRRESYELTVRYDVRLTDGTWKVSEVEETNRTPL